MPSPRASSHRAGAPPAVSDAGPAHASAAGGPDRTGGDGQGKEGGRDGGGAGTSADGCAADGPSSSSSGSESDEDGSEGGDGDGGGSGAPGKPAVRGRAFECARGKGKRREGGGGAAGRVCAWGRGQRLGFRALPSLLSPPPPSLSSLPSSRTQTWTTPPTSRSIPVRLHSWWCLQARDPRFCTRARARPRPSPSPLSCLSPTLPNHNPSQPHHFLRGAHPRGRDGGGRPGPVPLHDAYHGAGGEDGAVREGRHGGGGAHAPRSFPFFSLFFFLTLTFTLTYSQIFFSTATTTTTTPKKKDPTPRPATTCTPCSSPSWTSCCSALPRTALRAPP